jgi:hypothetical protein
MDDDKLQDQGVPNPRQAEVDRIRDAAAAGLADGRGARQAAPRASDAVRVTREGPGREAAPPG